MKMVNLMELINETKTTRGAIPFLQQRTSLPKRKLCKNEHKMLLYINEKDTKHYRWRCKFRKCRQDVGIRTYNCLKGSRLAIGKLLLFIYVGSEKTIIDFCK